MEGLPVQGLQSVVSTASAPSGNWLEKCKFSGLTPDLPYHTYQNSKDGPISVFS